MDELPIGKLNKFANDGEKSGVVHILLGKFNTETGLYQGQGLHSPHTLKALMDNHKDVEIWNKGRTIQYKKYEDIPVTSNGLRDIEISRENSFSAKTMFPDTWCDEDIVDAIIEAASQPTGNGGFSKVVTKNGFSVPVEGYFKDGTNLITTAFPKYE